jgi:CubicO group peptidase (beta-lactamase class C family)
MKDTHFVLPRELVPRVAERPPEAYLSPSHGPFMRGIDSDQFRAFPGGGDGLFSTARDVLAFGQAILEGGSVPGSDDDRILSRAAVAAMVRDQNPDAPAIWGDTLKYPASWGYGWMIQATPKWKYFQGSLSPLGTLCHPGRSGVKLWIDLEHEIVGVYFEAVVNETKDGELLWKCDLFENAVNAAIEMD